MACKNYKVCSLVGLLALGLWGLPHPPVSAQERREPVPMVARAEEDDDRQYRWERVPNPHPLISPDQVPGFTMDYSTFNRGLRKKHRPEYSLFEQWTTPTLPNTKRATFLNVKLYLTKNRAQAVKAAKAVFGAETGRNQNLKVIGRPNPGSYSGESIGDVCWAWGANVPGRPRQSLNRSSSLVVVKDGDLLSVRLSGPLELGGGVEDRQTEALARALIERLRDWPRPQ